MKRFYIKVRSWEYWPMWLVYLPVSFYYLYLALRARSLFFFSASNPGIETGGMFFESKWKIFEAMPTEYFPATIFISEHDDLTGIERRLNEAGISFPLIAKPDRGGRGWGVKKIYTPDELKTYRKNMQVSFLIQAFSPYPLELSVFYVRQPGSEKGRITSVTFKQLLTVKGDGKSTLSQLIKSNNRAYLQYQRLATSKHIQLNEVPALHEERLLVPYGNHVLGATFLNYEHIVDEALTQTFDAISKRIPGFYFGRYDLKCASIDALKQGKEFSILELNGAGAEPAHIYEPGYSFFKAQRELAAYVKGMFDTAVENNKRGVLYMCYSEFRRLRKLEKAYRLRVTEA